MPRALPGLRGHKAHVARERHLLHGVCRSRSCIRTTGTPRRTTSSSSLPWWRTRAGRDACPDPQTGSRLRLVLHDVDDWETRIGVEAGCALVDPSGNLLRVGSPPFI